MEVLNLPKIVLSPFPEESSRLELQSVMYKSVRGSNFETKAKIFVDTQNQLFVWKKLRFPNLVNEYIVSYLANSYGIKVPLSHIGFTGHSFGLIQEWIADATELSKFGPTEPVIKENADLYSLIVFLAWIGAKDRHGSNYLLKAEGDFYAIDFEECFTTSSTGSEICLYFPSILEHQEKLSLAVNDLKQRITQTKLEQMQQNLKILVDLPEDERGKKALLSRIDQIFQLLKKNLLNLEEVVGEFILKSQMPEETSALF